MNQPRIVVAVAVVVIVSERGARSRRLEARAEHAIGAVMSWRVMGGEADAIVERVVGSGDANQERFAPPAPMQPPKAIAGKVDLDGFVADIRLADYYHVSVGAIPAVAPATPAAEIDVREAVCQRANRIARAPLMRDRVEHLLPFVEIALARPEEMEIGPDQFEVELIVSAAERLYLVEQVELAVVRIVRVDRGGRERLLGLPPIRCGVATVRIASTRVAILIDL